MSYISHQSLESSQSYYHRFGLDREDEKRFIEEKVHKCGYCVINEVKEEGDICNECQNDDLVIDCEKQISNRKRITRAEMEVCLSHLNKRLGAK